MNPNNKQVHKAAMWRWALIAAVSIILIVLVMQNGIRSNASLHNYIIVSIIIAVISVPIVLFVAMANIVIEDNHINHRNVFGFRSKTVDLNHLVSVSEYRAIAPRQLNTILKLVDNQGNHIKVRINSTFFFLIDLPEFQNQRLLMDTIDRYAEQSGKNTKN